jgi:Arc/MetJ-type ribon-helix-helix transcriptional regulator
MLSLNSPDRAAGTRHSLLYAGAKRNQGSAPTSVYCVFADGVIQFRMQTLTVRLPEALVAQIEAESRRRKLSKSDVVRERLAHTGGTRRRPPSSLDAIADLVGSVDRLPRDLSGRTKRYLKSTRYGEKRPG